MPGDFEVRRDDATICIFDLTNFPTIEAVVAAVVPNLGDMSVLIPGCVERFEVWQDGRMVAAARLDDAADRYVVGPPFDRTRKMPDRIVRAFDKFFPGLLDE